LSVLINCFSTIRYNYKLQLIIIQDYSKGGAFIQEDYLEQVLESAIKSILVDFGQLLYCCKIQPTNKEEIANAIIEE
jgi:hypothetical protein